MANGNLPFPFPDAVSQFSVESTVLGAQDGEHTGGLVNVVTRSGTNTYHGSRLRVHSQQLSRRHQLLLRLPDTLHQNQFGGTFGGRSSATSSLPLPATSASKPIKVQASTEAFVPTAANLAGDFSVTDGPNLRGLRSIRPTRRPAYRRHAARQQVSYPACLHPAVRSRCRSICRPSTRRSTSTTAGWSPTPSHPQTFDNQFVTRVD